MVAILWILVGLCFLLSFIGLLFPMIPALLFLWMGVVLYHFGIDSHSLSIITLGTYSLFTLVLLGADQISNVYFIKKTGGSRKSGFVAFVGVTLGIFILPPFGLILVPFGLVLLVELLSGKTLLKATDVALCTLLAFGTSLVAKALIHLLLILVFFFDIR